MTNRDGVDCKRAGKLVRATSSKRTPKGCTRAAPGRRRPRATIRSPSRSNDPLRAAADRYTATTTGCGPISVRSARHHLYVDFPPVLAGVINRNPCNNDSRQGSKRDRALRPTLRRGGIVLTARIWLGHSVLCFRFCAGPVASRHSPVH
jgi:hypothetical protein